MDTRDLHLLLFFDGVYFEVLQDITILQLTKPDVTDTRNWLQPQDTDVKLGQSST